MYKSFKEIIDFIRELYQQPNGFIPLHAPVFNGNEKKYLEECIDSTYVSSVGGFVDLFEKKAAEYTDAKSHFCSSLKSRTAGLIQFSSIIPYETERAKLKQ